MPVSQSRPVSGSSFSPTLSPLCRPQAWDLPGSISISICPDSNLETDFGGKRARALLRGWRRGPEEGAAVLAAPKGKGGQQRHQRAFQSPDPSDAQRRRPAHASTHTGTQWVEASQMLPAASPEGPLSAICQLGAHRASGGSGRPQGSREEMRPSPQDRPWRFSASENVQGTCPRSKLMGCQPAPRNGACRGTERSAELVLESPSSWQGFLSLSAPL